VGLSAINAAEKRKQAYLGLGRGGRGSGGANLESSELLPQRSGILFALADLRFQLPHLLLGCGELCLQLVVTGRLCWLVGVAALPVPGCAVDFIVLLPQQSDLVLEAPDGHLRRARIVAQLLDLFLLLFHTLVHRRVERGELAVLALQLVAQALHLSLQSANLGLVLLKYRSAVPDALAQRDAAAT
jgi:hypothetical protein